MVSHPMNHMTMALAEAGLIIMRRNIGVTLLYSLLDALVMHDVETRSVRAHSSVVV